MMDEDDAPSLSSLCLRVSVVKTLQRSGGGRNLCGVRRDCSPQRHGGTEGREESHSGLRAGIHENRGVGGCRIKSGMMDEDDAPSLSSLCLRVSVVKTLQRSGGGRNLCGVRRDCSPQRHGGTEGREESHSGLRAGIYVGCGVGGCRIKSGRMRMTPLLSLLCASVSLW